jgi:hypothetical protein
VGSDRAFKARFEGVFLDVTAQIEIPDTRGRRHPPSEDLKRMGQAVPTVRSA